MTTMSEQLTYTLVQNCLKEAVYASLRRDQQQRSQYLSLVAARLRELRQEHRMVFLGNQSNDQRSRYFATRGLAPLFQSISQYARISHQVH
ncbi:hypothetical protein [Leptolyngbya sp. FACHB-8]|uniref:hypothetical protein n=1 Tax=unclassified Leptolyngbya TaxID=2650499 RepID=UPI0016888911|nr:hypothetical protein [Leptolyngbya sp. FACHB-8]MBD1911039.1 hypothetical protein [Leptolyngbya sp. FACHB-8]